MLIDAPYLLFLGDVQSFGYAKTAAGICQWHPDHCKGQFRLPDCKVDLGLPDLTISEAAAQGARSMVLGVANDGGYIADSWIDTIVAALEAGLDVAAGLHQKLVNVPIIAETAAKNNRKLTDVRYPDQTFSVGTGEKRSGKRVLAVGTDCAVGKKYTALAVAKALNDSGAKATFRATGQTGIMISGRGIAIDSVVSDFVAGAAEWISPNNDPDHWDVIEGQGSLFHPSYAGVSLGLLHGSQPDALIICHDTARRRMGPKKNFPVPSIEECMETNLKMARLTNPNVRVAGVSFNTSQMSDEEAKKYLAEAENRLGLPCLDPIRTGAEKIAIFLRTEF